MLIRRLFEKIGLGGPSGVRAYAVGEATVMLKRSTASSARIRLLAGSARTALGALALVAMVASVLEQHAPEAL